MPLTPLNPKINYGSNRKQLLVVGCLSPLAVAVTIFTCSDYNPAGYWMLALVVFILAVQTAFLAAAHRR